MDLEATLAVLKAASAAEPKPGVEIRLDRIARCVDLLVEGEQAICAALSADFMVRGAEMTRMAEVLAPIRHAQFVSRNLRRWMRPERRRADFPYPLFGGRAYIEQQPLGVIGIIVPWNGPVGMAITALIDAFSAGNRAFIKMSEHAPHAGAAFAELIAKHFRPDEVAIANGPAEVSRRFADLPFDHLLFTGGTEIGRQVMQAAARNLVPVTLELGGKCPAIVGPDADLQESAMRIVAGRLLNAGQGCITPDYVLLPEQQLQDFARHADQAARALYPRISGNTDYTSIINQRHFQRVTAYVDEARAAGCTVIESTDAGDAAANRELCLIAPTFILDPPASLRIMREEVFGPVLAILPYRSLDEAIDYVNARPRPLALYYFGRHEASKRRVLDRTVSGGVTVNDTLTHLLMAELPFGGVGASGTGRYWGGDAGFKRFSNPRSVYEQGRVKRFSALIRPPYGRAIRAVLKSQIKKLK